MGTENRRIGLIIGILVGIIVLLSVLLAYFLWAKPTYQGFVGEKQQEAYNIGQVELLNGILVQIQQQGFVQIPLNENQTLYLMPFNPNQVNQQPALEETEPSA